MARPQDRALAARPPALSGRERYRRFLEADSERSRAMAAAQAVTAEAVSGVILKDLDRSDGAWRVEPVPVTGRDSWVFKAHTPLAPWPLAVKVFCAAVTPEDVAARGEHLRNCHHSMADSALAVPAYWGCLPQHRTLIMEWIDAPRLDDLMARAGRRRDERSALFAVAGAWLGRYHALSAAAVRPLRVASFPHHIDMLLGGEDGAGRQVRDRVFRRSYEALLDHAGAAGKCRVAHVTAHGDFVPHNVFHGGGRTVGFDMVARVRPALSDICHFLVHAEIRKPLTAGLARLGPSGLPLQDVQAFLAAYGGQEAIGGEDVMAYMQLNEALLRWAVIISHLRRGGRRRGEHLLSWMRYRRMAARAAAALEGGFLAP